MDIESEMDEEHKSKIIFKVDGVKKSFLSNTLSIFFDGDDSDDQLWGLVKKRKKKIRVRENSMMEFEDLSHALQ